MMLSCPICYSTDNIAVAYYGRKHVCVKCRKLMRDEHGNQTRIFLDENG
jgi:transcription initiation factor TFIIIB Brf1 subunit/transcription initiation factor TFIIB